MVCFLAHPVALSAALYLISISVSIFVQHIFFVFHVRYNVIVRPSVCCLSVTLVHPTQAIEFLAMFLCYLVRWPSADIQVKFYRDRPRGTLGRRS